MKELDTYGFCIVEKSDCKNCPEVKEGHVYCSKEKVIVSDDVTPTRCLEYAP